MQRHASTDFLPMNMSFTRTLLPSILLLAALPSHAAIQVWQGTIGQQAVTVEIDDTDAPHIQGRYFYQKYLRDIPLSGVLKHGKTLSLSEKLMDDDPKKAPTLVLESRGNQGWQGSWQQANGKHHLDIALHPVTLDNTGEASGFLKTLASDNPYEYLRQTALHPQKQAQQKIGSYTLQWYREPLSQLRSFEIIAGYDDTTRAQLNQLLQDTARQQLVDFHSCMLGASRFGGEFEQVVTPTLVSPKILSVDYFTNYFCGGAHPDFSHAPLVIDVATMKPLSLEDVLWVGKGKPIHYQDDSSISPDNRPSVDFETYANYRSKHLAPWLAQQMATLYPSKVKGKNKDDECRYDNPEVWEFPGWTLTPAGIRLTPSFARFARSCETIDWAVIPYSVVNKHPGTVNISTP